MRDLIGRRCRIGVLSGIIVAVDEAARAVDVLIDGTARIQSFAVDEITLS
jgi:hypothetical protein